MFRNGPNSPPTAPITPRWAPSNLGFYEYRARAYHPGLGRFMSEDPKDFEGGDYNLFRYCHNDPEVRTDAMGLEGNNVSVTDWKGLHIEQELEQRELAGLDTTAGRASQSALEGVFMAQESKLAKQIKANVY